MIFNNKLLFSAIALLCALGFWREVQKYPESDNYLIFANEIQTLRVFGNDLPDPATVVAAPAYPVLLAFSESIFGSVSFSVQVLHVLFMLAALWLFVVRFTPFVGSKAAMLLVFLAMFVWREYYSLILTEWLSLCGLLVFLSVLPLQLFEFTVRRLFLISLIASFLILLRPDFFSLLPVLAGLILCVIPKEHWRRAFVVILCGLLPVFLWSVFNLYRLNTFSVAAVSGHNLFGNAALIGSTTFGSDPGLKIARFADYINAKKVPAAGQEAETLNEMVLNYAEYQKMREFNVNQLALNFEQEAGIQRAEYDSLMRKYAVQVIKESPLAYLKLFLAGVGIAKKDLWLILVSLICLALMVRNGHGMTIVLAVSLALHISHLLFLSFTQLVTDRYYLVTLIPFGMLTVAALLSATGIGPKSSTAR